MVGPAKMKKGRAAHPCLYSRGEGWKRYDFNCFYLEATVMPTTSPCKSPKSFAIGIRELGAFRRRCLHQGRIVLRSKLENIVRYWIASFGHKVIFE